MRVHVAVLAALIGLASQPERVQAQGITGVVVEDGSRTPVTGAQVVLLDSEATPRALTLTDSTGAFAIAIPGAGRYSLRVERLGYRTWVSSPLRFERGEILAVEVRLGPGAIPLEPLVVTARGGPLYGRAAEFHQRRTDPARTGGFFITRDDMDRSLGARTSDVLARAPGVVLNAQPSTPGAIPRYTIRMLGAAGGDMSGTCVPAVFLDGVPLGPGTSIDDVLDPSMLEGVEVYSRTMTAPVQYLRSNDCGVVLFWTRLPEQGRDWSWKRLALGGAAALGLLFLIVFR